MSKMYLVLCTRHESIYGNEWCVWWGRKESKSGYSSDVRFAHRFTEEEIEKFKDDKQDIPIPIDLLKLPEGYPDEENTNYNLRVLIEKGTINKLTNLNLSPNEEMHTVICGECGNELDENNIAGYDLDLKAIYKCPICDKYMDYEGNELEDYSNF